MEMQRLKLMIIWRLNQDREVKSRDEIADIMIADAHSNDYLTYGETLITTKIIANLKKVAFGNMAADRSIVDIKK